MPQSATETKPIATQLWEEFETRKRLRDDAAAVLAYDVTFRAEDSYDGQHERPSDTLTAQLKANYRSACAAADVAYAAWAARERGDF